MVIPHSIPFEESLIIAGCGNGFILKLNVGQQLVFLSWMSDPHGKPGAARQPPERLDVSREGHNSGSGAGPLHRARGQVSRVALSDSAHVHLHARLGQKHSAGHVIQLNP